MRRSLSICSVANDGSAPKLMVARRDGVGHASSKMDAHTCSPCGAPLLEYGEPEFPLCVLNAGGGLRRGVAMASSLEARKQVLVKQQAIIAQQNVLVQQMKSVGCSKEAEIAQRLLREMMTLCDRMRGC